MWNSLPPDLMANIFFFLSPDSLARASSACHHWHICAKTYLSTTASCHPKSQPPWFLAVPMRNQSLCCYAHNPIMGNWHVLSLDFLANPVRPIEPIGSLLLLRFTNSTTLRLAICNPFTRQHRHLPTLNISRTNPAVGMMMPESTQHIKLPCFRIYVVGGMSEAIQGGATYEPSLEMYDSKDNIWQVVGSMPVEFAVRLTVWTPNESVYMNGVLYWVTSARAYSVIGFEISSSTWRELNVPMAEQLEFAALGRRKGKLILVGGTCGGNACLWELGRWDTWHLTEKVPIELGLRFLKGKTNWSRTKCVGTDDAICLYRDLSSGMLVWREVADKGGWEWTWVDGFSFKEKQVQNVQVKGTLMHPTLACSCIF